MRYLAFVAVLGSLAWQESHIPICKSLNCQVIGDVQPKPEPMDVPAIWVEKMAKCWHDGGRPMKCGEPCFDKAACHIKFKPRWSCEDPSRILLTAEDGSKHCIKFPKD